VRELIIGSGLVLKRSGGEGRGVVTGGYIRYTLPKSVQVNFLWRNNDIRTVIEHEY